MKLNLVFVFEFISELRVHGDRPPFEHGVHQLEVPQVHSQAVGLLFRSEPGFVDHLHGYFPLLWPARDHGVAEKLVPARSHEVRDFLPLRHFPGVGELGFGLVSLFVGLQLELADRLVDLQLVIILVLALQDFPDLFVVLREEFLLLGLLVRVLVGDLGLVERLLLLPHEPRLPPRPLQFLVAYKLLVGFFH